MRAPTEDLARQVASQAFTMPLRSAADRARLFSPWAQRELIRCTRLLQTPFREDGPATVLEPPHWVDTLSAALA